MLNNDLNYRVKELSDMINMMRSEIAELRNRFIENNMWDNNDMMRYWGISLRTLATWRSDGLIEFVQLGSKIWYSKENRDSFIQRNTVRSENKAA